MGYFERDGYYARDDGAHRDASTWAGKGAEALGLSSPVDREAFRRVLEGEVPGGQRLGRKEPDGTVKHRSGRDVTLSAPKSVSVMALASDDDRIVGAHDRAVAATLGWIENNAIETRMCDPATSAMVRAGDQKMVAASFRHDTSRNLDPQLHTHAVVAHPSAAAPGTTEDAYSALSGKYRHHPIAPNRLVGREHGEVWAPPAVNLAPRYNGCPTQDFVAVRREGKERTLTKLRWRLVLAWATDLKLGAKMINARPETVHEKPAFRSALRRRRCANPVSGWFEWRREAAVLDPPHGGRGVLARGTLGALEEGQRPGRDLHGADDRSFALAREHPLPPARDRRRRGSLDEWPDPGTSSERLLALAGAANDGPFERRAVSTRIDKPRNDDRERVVPLNT